MDQFQYKKIDLSADERIFFEDVAGKTPTRSSAKYCSWQPARCGYSLGLSKILHSIGSRPQVSAWLARGARHLSVFLSRIPLPNIPWHQLPLKAAAGFARVISRASQRKKPLLTLAVMALLSLVALTTLATVSLSNLMTVASLEGGHDFRIDAPVADRAKEINLPSEPNHHDQSDLQPKTTLVHMNEGELPEVAIFAQKKATLHKAKSADRPTWSTGKSSEEKSSRKQQQDQRPGHRKDVAKSTPLPPHHYRLSAPLTATTEGKKATFARGAIVIFLASTFDQVTFSTREAGSVAHVSLSEWRTATSLPKKGDA